MNKTFYLQGQGYGQLYLDKWLYRGRGRPRNTDYSSLAVLQQKHKTELKKAMHKQLFGGLNE